MWIFITQDNSFYYGGSLQDAVSLSGGSAERHQHTERKQYSYLCRPSGGEHAYDQEDYRRGNCILIGNEGNGLNPETARCADTWIRIPMAGQTESLECG